MDGADVPPSEARRPPDRVGGSLLFVCMANVCRSPTMTYLTRRRLEEHGLGEVWQLESAGTDAATEGSRMCRAAARAIEDVPAGQQFVRQHRSRQLGHETVAEAGLILVASQRERVSVTRLTPTSRGKTFTMLEAARLAAVAADRGAWPWSPAEPLVLDALREVLHGHRGALDDSDPSRSTWRRAMARLRHQDPLDVRDVHTGEVWSHAPIMGSLEWASQVFSRSVAALADGAAAGAAPAGSALPPDDGPSPRRLPRPGPS